MKGVTSMKNMKIAEFAVDYYQRMVTAEHRMQIKEAKESNIRRF